MGKNWGRTPISNADNLRAGKNQTSYMWDGEQRLDRRPLGKCERFVDPVGNVVTIQLVADGDSKPAETMVRERAQLHRKGFVEHAKCPIKHGTRNANAATAKEFVRIIAKAQNLATECARDPKVMARVDGDLHAQVACPHVEALVKYRIAEEARQMAKRNKARLEQEAREKEKLELQTAQLEMVKEQLEERKAKRKAKAAAE